MTILLAGGGSGGHILPNIALLQEIGRHYPQVQVVYCGEGGGMEEGMMREQGVPFYPIMAGKMRRYFSFQNMVDWFKVPVGCVQAYGHMLRVRPKVVFSKGGYVSVPVAIGAWLARVPLIIHESDVRPGLATRICSKFATKVCVSWEETRSYLPGKEVVLTGVPVRENLLTGDAALGREALSLKNDLPLLLVTGGSLGASDINDFVAAQLPELLNHWNVYHLTGKGKKVDTAASGHGMYVQQEFDAAAEDKMAAADVIVSRAGTTALAEFAAMGKKVLLIPLPADRSRGDQLDNAAAYAHQFPASTRILEQDQLTRETFTAALGELLAAPASAPQTTKATEQIASLLVKY